MDAAKLAGQIDDKVRLALSVGPDATVEIISLATSTALLLPRCDIALLIDGLRNLDRIGSTLETADLDPSS